MYWCFRPLIGKSALHRAVHADNIECVRELVTAGADVNKGDGTTGRTALHHTVQAANIVFTAELLLCVRLHDLLTIVKQSSLMICRDQINCL